MLADALDCIAMFVLGIYLASIPMEPQFWRGIKLDTYGVVVFGTIGLVLLWLGIRVVGGF
jgi:hypothetical protein